jgi:putative membrane protein
MAMIPLLAQMMDNDHMTDGTGWSWGWLAGITLMVALVALIIVLIVRLTGSNRSASPADSPRQPAEDVLAERLARGDINADEYRQRRDALRSS